MQDLFQNYVSDLLKLRDEFRGSKSGKPSPTKPMPLTPRVFLARPVAEQPTHTLLRAISSLRQYAAGAATTALSSVEKLEFPGNCEA